MSHKGIDFLIVGAMKAGTTTLMRYLVHNPHIAIPNDEIHYFDRESNYRKGLDWYKRKFPVSELTQIVGEKTPTYSYDPKVPKRIYNNFPDCKVVWLFRNPVDRTYSNYIHAVMNGAENLSFEKAVDQEEKRIKENIFKGYKKRSIYIEQVERYLSYFPKENMHYIIFENFINEPYKKLGELYEFLGVENKVIEEEKNQKEIKSNQSYVPLSIGLQYYSRSLFGGYSKIYKAANYVNKVLSRPRPSLSSSMRLKLNNFFSEYNQQLADLIDEDLSVWVYNKQE